MKIKPDLSIGQRLSLGFALGLAILGVVVMLSFYWQNDSEQAQKQLLREIIPRQETAHALELSILYTAAYTRSYLISPDAARLARSTQSIARTAELLHRLGTTVDAADETEFMRQVELRTRAYLEAVRQAIDTRAAGPLTPQQESQLTAARDHALQTFGGFRDLQAQRAQAAIEAMADARERVRSAVVTASALAALCFLVFAAVTIRSVRAPAKRLLGIAKALEAGNLKPALNWAPGSDGLRLSELPSRDEMHQIARAFGAAASALALREERSRAKRKIASAAASSLDEGRIAHEALPALLEHVKAELGVVYVLDEARMLLSPVASQAVGTQLHPLRLGEGIPGEAARSGRRLVVRDIPADSGFQVRLGYDQAAPRAVAAIPIRFAGEVLGVLLVASLRDITGEMLTFLDDAAAQLGSGLKNARAHRETQHLLARVREQNELIQSQNEELQAQSEEIQAQHEELQAQNEELLQQGEEVLRHAESLRAADERKNEFLGVLAHELRNPMAPISNSLHILRRAEPGSELARRAQEVIERQTQHLVRLIDDLLDVTRISRGKISLQRDDVDLVAVVRECVEDHRTRLESNQHRLELQVPAAPLWIEGDPTRLCQVVGNLLHNAIKFSGPGQCIRLSLRDDASTGQVVLRVADTGIGIEGELLPQLFEPFSQGNMTLARTEGGLGLGLALVKTFVELHGGTVEAHSDGPQRGAEFIVRLPRAQRVQQAEPASAPAQAAEGDGRSDASGTVLIIEDNLDAAQTLRIALELAGYCAHVAHTGPDGLRCAEAVAPRVVLCDVGLPGMDGYEVARQLRAHPTLNACRLIALTGYATQEDRERAARAGFDHHVAKPPSMERLMQLIRMPATSEAG